MKDKDYNVIIHVGYPKTATTWLQERLFPYVENYKYVNRKDVVEKILDVNAFDFDPVKARKYFDDKYGEKIIISEERIIADLRNKGVLIKENIKRFKLVFPEAKILIFLRNQVEIMASKYSQYISAGGTYSIKKYLYRPKNSDFRIEEIFTPYLYDKVIKYYYSIYGQENVFIYLFEEFIEDPMKIINTLVDKFDFKIKELPNINPVNSRLRLIIYFILRFVNIFTRKRRIYKYYFIHIPYLFEITRVISSALNKYKIFGPPIKTNMILKRNNILYIKNYYKYSNKKLVEDLDLICIEKYGYPL